MLAHFDLMSYCKRFYYDETYTITSAAFLASSLALGAWLVTTYSKTPKRDDYDIGRRVIFPAHLRLLVFLAAAELIHAIIQAILIYLVKTGKLAARGFEYSLWTGIAFGIDNVAIGIFSHGHIVTFIFIRVFCRGNGRVAGLQRDRNTIV